MTAVGEPVCDDVAVVFARGTGEPGGLGAVGDALAEALQARLPGRTVGKYGVVYPASYDFDAVRQGVEDAMGRLQTVARACTKTKIVFGGYSQGAAVVGYTLTDVVPADFSLPPGVDGPLPESIASHVVSVVPFGMPKAGVIRLLAPSAPPMSIASAYDAKLLELCAPHDPICDSGLDLAAHHAYLDNGMVDQAADFAAAAILST